MAATTDQVLFVISIPPALEDQLIDWLLERDGAAGFTSWPSSGHSSDAARLSTSEKVSGKQRRLTFEVQLPAERLSTFTAGLRESFGGADVHYWVVPLLDAGSLRGRGPAGAAA